MSGEPNTVSLASALVNSNHRFRKECMLIVMASVEEVTKHMRVITGLKGKETEATIVPQAKFRPYYSEKVVGGTGSLTARTLSGPSILSPGLASAPQFFAPVGCCFWV